jgi:hypothetical protein
VGDRGGGGGSCGGGGRGAGHCDRLGSDLRAQPPAERWLSTSTTATVETVEQNFSCLCGGGQEQSSGRDDDVTNRKRHLH